MGIRIGIGRISIGSGGAGAVDTFNPSFLIISEGIRITFTPVSGTETEIWVSQDGGVLTLGGTAGVGVTTYDYSCDDGHNYIFRLRAKYDTTVLNIPQNVTLNINNNVVTITWVDNNTEAEGIEIWANIDSLGYLLLATVNDGVETYEHTVVGNSVTYKVRAKEGTLPVYSDFTAEQNISLDPTPAVVKDTSKCLAYFDAIDVSTVTKNGSNEVSRHNDKNGTGHDLSNVAGTPTWLNDGIRFNSDVDRLKSNAFTFNQPVYFYGLIKVLTTNNGSAKYLIDGNGNNNCALIIGANGSGLLWTAGSWPTGPSSNHSEWMIVRAFYNGANSKCQVNDNTAKTGNVGANSMGGISLNRMGGYAGEGISWIYNKLIFMNTDEGEADIYNFLNLIKDEL